MKSKVYSQEGKEVGTVELPERVFGLPANPTLVHQVVYAMLSNARIPIAHTKERGEVRGGGKKPWKQKGTGRARHGSRRSPIWRGGGITFGPTNARNFKKKVNKKAKKKALYTVLSEKFRDNEIVFVDALSVKEAKTKYAKEILNNLSSISGLDQRRKNWMYITLPEKNREVLRSFKNIRNVRVGNTKDANVLDLMSYKYFVVADPQRGVKILEKESQDKP